MPPAGLSLGLRETDRRPPIAKANAAPYADVKALSS
jgi:hypothetical protein